MTLPPPQFSEDGLLWWDGGQWLPATTAAAPLAQTTPSYGPAPRGFGAAPSRTAEGTELLPDETVLREGRLHWWSACWPAAGFVGLGLLYAPLLLVISPLAALTALLLWCLPAALAVGVGKVRQGRSSFVLTDHRLLVRQGVLRRSSSELLLRQVESATVDQSPVSGLLGYGDVTLSGTGGSAQVLRGVIAPEDFRAAVQRAVAAAQRPAS